MDRCRKYLRNGDKINKDGKQNRNYMKHTWLY